MSISVPVTVIVVVVIVVPVAIFVLFLVPAVMLAVIPISIIVVAAAVPVVIMPSSISVWHSYVDMAAVLIDVVRRCLAILLPVIIPGFSRVDDGGKTDKGHSGGHSSN